MKKLFAVVMAWTAVGLISCTKDDPKNPSNPDPGVEKTAIKLDCRYDKDITLKNHREGVDYTADCLVEIFKTLTIEPGVTVEFSPNGGIETASSGHIDFDGDSGSMITLKGSSSSGWVGIYLARSGASNTMDHVRIENAGHGEGFFSFRKEPAAITLAGRLSMSDCIIENSNGVGIITRDESHESSIQEFEDNEFKNCATFPVKVAPNNIKNMDLESCKFKENGENFVVLDTKSKERLTEDITLEEIDVPYLLSDDIDLYAGLTIEAGVDLVMENNVTVQCSYQDAGYLNIAGTQSKHVTIRGKESISGYWKGILVTSDNVKNIFEYLDISDAGSSALGWAEKGANISLGDKGKLVLNNCTSARSLTSCDLSVYTHTATPTLTNNSPELKVCLKE